ncbi:MAG: U32 family peptidase [Clostridia bacterium]|nr:U32 family peptidase [Clostridia bacterium]
MIKKAELLSPAGNFERLQTAFRFGADAVYIGASAMSLRNFADNFTPQELIDAVNLAHSLDKKVYVTVNAFARDNDIASLPILLEQIKAASPDALIVNDPGVIRVLRRTLPDMPLHLSTQANTLNSESAMFWHDQGISRIVLARELSLDDIKRMRDNIPDELELEMFVHGAMCVSYSGRCLLSNYIDGRDSNRGECVQPCRWKYELREKGKDGEFYTMEEDENGTFIMNSRDLRLIEYLPQIIDAGVCSLKIEGRMKSISYVAAVTNAYRMALDFFEKEGKDAILSEAIVNELSKASHRPFTTGFFNGKNADALQETSHAGYIQDAMICATVEEYDADNKVAHVFQRNRFFVNDTLEILSPCDIGRTFSVEWIKDAEGNALECAPHPKQELYIGCSEPLKKGDILKMSGEIKRY